MSVIYKILGILAALFAALFGARQWGRESVKREQAEEALKNAKQADKIDSDVRAQPDAELDKRLRKYTRD